MPSNTVRLAKNTLMLYFRQIIIMLVSLYTVRVVLETLGAEDYGIYHAVAGIVTMFGFLSNSMASASQRYFSFEIGRGGIDQLQKVFSLSIFIYILISILVIILAETVGLWFVDNKIAIPTERKGTALWVYHFSIISFLFTLFSSPYMAMIIAHEDMNIYAYVSIIEVMIRLGVVFILKFILLDKLQLYGILMCIATIIITIVYFVICTVKYSSCRYKYYWDNKLFKEIASYSAWNLFGASAGIFKNQITNILLIQFFNPIVVAAKTIATQVDNAVMSFSQNFNNALRPQLIKNYAGGEKESMLLLMFRGCKGTFLLMYLFALPLILEMHTVLGLWLKYPPEYTVLFTRLMLIDILITSISYPLMAVAQATGKIKLYQSVVGGILLLNVPVSLVFLLLGAPPYSVLIVAIILSFTACISRLLILKLLIDYSIVQFIMKVVIPVLLISAISSILPIILNYYLIQDIFRLIIVTIVSIIMVLICSYYIGINKEERLKLKKIIRCTLLLKGKKINYEKCNISSMYN